MSRQNNPRNGPRNMEQVVHAGPQGRPVSPQNEGPFDYIDDPYKRWMKERKAMGYKIHNLKYKLNRLEGIVELREKAFKVEYKEKHETIASHEAMISNLKTDLQFRMAQLDSLQAQSNQEKEDMAARLEVEKQKLSEQNYQMLQLKLDNHKSVLLQIDLQKQMKQLEQELQNKDDVILDLGKENVALSHKLTETTNQLTNNKAEFLQSEQAWQTKYKALQENFSELEDKEQSWKTRVEQVEETKQEVEETNQEVEETNEEQKEVKTDKKIRKKEKKEMKMRQKQEKEDLKAKQKLEKHQEKEMKKKEKQMKAELQKRAKEEKKEMKRKSPSSRPRITFPSFLRPRSTLSPSTSSSPPSSHLPPSLSEPQPVS